MEVDVHKDYANHAVAQSEILGRARALILIIYLFLIEPYISKFKIVIL